MTSNFVLDETYTGLRTKVRHVAAVDFGKRIRQSRVVLVVHISEQLEEDAWELFKRCSDKSFSFTDCTSFVIMKQVGLMEAFTNDHPLMNHTPQKDFTRTQKSRNSIISHCAMSKNSNQVCCKLTKGCYGGCLTRCPMIM